MVFCTAEAYFLLSREARANFLVVKSMEKLRHYAGYCLR